jgi:hypothetical protein
MPKKITKYLRDILETREDSVPESAWRPSIRKEYRGAHSETMNKQAGIKRSVSGFIVERSVSRKED